MTVHIVTGKLGAGKSLVAVARCRTYMQQGRRVATNLDICPDRMLPAMHRGTITRLPDKPRLEDLQLLGTGDGRPIDDYDESRFGLLVLDEMASWFNSRSWNDKSRAQVIEWFLHARKYHWDILFLVQDVEAIDKQLRGSLCEHLVVCKRLDRIGIPLIGGIIKAITGVRLTLPKMHLALVFYGESSASLVVDRWIYMARDLYQAYRTGQVFSNQEEVHNGQLVDMRASYTVLSAWHTKGRYLVPYTWSKIVSSLVGFTLLACVAPVLILTTLASGRSPGASVETLGLPRRKPSYGITPEERRRDAQAKYSQIRFAS